jgi:hypothetical protein
MNQMEQIKVYMKDKDKVDAKEIATATNISLGNVRWILCHYKAVFEKMGKGNYKLVSVATI